MSRYSQNKGIARIVRELVKEGWRYSISTHPRVTAPTGEFITFALTPSDSNAHRQFERDVRRLKRTLALKHKEQTP